VKTSLVGFALITAFAPFVATASAEPYDVAPIVVPDGIFGMPPSDVVVIVQSSGLHPISPPIRRGRVYVLRAMDPSGENVRVVVDAASGRIFSVTPTDGYPPPGYGPGPAYGQEPAYGPGPAYGQGPAYGPGPAYGQGPAYGPGPGYEPGPYYRPPGPDYYGPRDQRDYYGPEDQGFDSAPGARTNVAPTARANPSEPRSAALTPRTPLPRPRPVNASVATSADATHTVPSQATNGASQQSSDQAHSTQEKVGGDKPGEASAGKPASALPPVTPLD
jgi:hypothetical protein